jgi:hypothetical protein
MCIPARVRHGEKRQERKTGGGGAIFINNKLKYSLKDGLYDGDGKIEACAIELYTGEVKILIVSCYNENGAESMEKILRAIRR